MQRRSLVLGTFCLLVTHFTSAFCQAGTADPLRFVPAQADLVVKVDEPGRLLQDIYNLEAIRDLQKLDVVRNFYENPNTRRFEQVVRFVEKKLGFERYELLDRLAGGGSVLAAKFGGGEPLVLVVIQAKDAKLMQSFAELALTMAEEEAGRQGKPFQPKKAKYRDHEVMSFDDKLFLCVADGALLATSKAKVMHMALDCCRGDEKSIATFPALLEGRKELDQLPSVWGWLNLESLRQLPGAQKGFEDVAKDPNSLIFTGPYIDIVRRAPFATMGLYHKSNDYLLSFRLPRGREGMDELAALTLAPDDRPALPLLEPKGVLVSMSYFLDLKKLWDNRAKLLKEDQLKQLDEADKNSGRFLGGARLNNLVQQVGPYQRIVVAQTDPSTYKKKPQVQIPSFAMVVDMRDAAFGRSMETVLRGAALLAGFQVSLKLVEEDRAGAKLVSFHFEEDKELKQDEGNIRFNFSPCFATINNQFLVSSSVELGRDLIDIIAKQDPKQFAKIESLKIYSSGAAALLRTFEDQLLTQAVLAEAFDPKTAREQLRALAQIIENLGVLENSTHFGATQMRHDYRLTLGKQ